MNDDFLRRIRVEPPPDFLRRLKSRLDLQPPPPKPAKRSLLRALAIAVLFAGAVFATTLLTLNREKAQEPVSANTKTLPRDMPPQPRQETPMSAAAKVPAVDTKPAAATVNPTPTAPSMTANLVAPKALVPYLTFALKRTGVIPDIATTESSATALTEFCGIHDSVKPNVYPVLAVTTRRITKSEFDSCTHKIGHIAEVSLGYQAIVFARSKVYGTFSLTPTQIFLALAAEIPDPAQPGKLIPNPNTMWSDVDSRLEREPIEVFGPEPSSPWGMAFQQILFEPGCRAIPELAAAKECPKLRKDGAYEEVSDSTPDLLLKLESKPNALGIIGFGLFEQYAAQVSVSPIAGVVPSRETLANGTYPGARQLYLYVNNETGNFSTRYLPSWLANIGTYVPDRFGILPPAPSPPRDPSAVPPKLPDLNLQ